MSGLLAIALSNLLVASLIAVFAVMAGNLRRPALAHGLWLLFFVKLLTPPLFPIEFAWSLPAQSASEAKPILVEAQAAKTAAPRLAEVSGEFSAAAESVEETVKQEGSLVAVVPASDRQPTLPVENPPDATPTGESLEILWAETWTVLWLTGSVGWFGLAGARLLRFRGQMRFGRPAPVTLQDEARRLAEQLQVTCPRVWVLPGALSPMLWVLGRTPHLLVPAGLLDRLDDVQRQALLIHELAHWRRRDHWVRWLELAVLSLYWWCPLVWWARGQMQEAEEECCDAWVVWMMPGAARGYALALVETVDFLAGARAALPPVASGIAHVRLLKRRLTMIMRGTTPRTLTLSGGLAVLGLGALLLPLMPSLAQSPLAAVQPRPEQAEPTPRRGGGGDNSPDKVQQDLKRMQQELDRARQDLERRMKELQLRTQELNVMIERAKTAAADPAGRLPERKSNPSAGPRAGQGPGGGGGFSGGQGSGFPAAGGFGGGGFMAGPMGMPGPDMDKRLREVERKLDLLIQLMRQGGRPGAQGGPGGGGNNQPGFGQNPFNPPAGNLPPSPNGAPGGFGAPGSPPGPRGALPPSPRTSDEPLSPLPVLPPGERR